MFEAILWMAIGIAAYLWFSKTGRNFPNVRTFLHRVSAMGEEECTNCRHVFVVHDPHCGIDTCKCLRFH